MNKFSKKYLDKYYSQLINKFESQNYSYEISQIAQKLKNCKIKKGKVGIFGNGGSAAISSHFSVDLTKIGKIRCVNFNEADLITCFSNDYGYENWIKKAVEFYLDRKDILILISSSGISKNIINAANYAKRKGIFLITFSGFNKNNPLSKKGKINVWINSKIYNHVENIHQIYLLGITDLIAKTKI